MALILIYDFATWDNKSIYKIAICNPSTARVNAEKYSRDTHSSEKRMIMLDEKFQRNASKFAIYFLYETPKSLSSFRAT